MVSYMKLKEVLMTVTGYCFLCCHMTVAHTKMLEYLSWLLSGFFFK